jgi:hypothetical protein
MYSTNRQHPKRDAIRHPRLILAGPAEYADHNADIIYFDIWKLEKKRITNPHCHDDTFDCASLPTQRLS